MKNTQRSYKATYNGKCRDITYEIGNTYTFNGEISLCSYGFHFCNDFDSLLEYYPMKSDLKIFEIKVLGKVITKGNKSVTNSLKILKEIPLSKFKKALKNHKYDKNNNLIYSKDSKGEEYWSKYNKNNNLIYSKDSKGYESWCEYDKNNNLIHFKSSKGYEYWKEYDENNNLIHFKNSDGVEWCITIK